MRENVLPNNKATNKYTIFLTIIAIFLPYDINTCQLSAFYFVGNL
jgi:hypothetical protein